MNTRTRVWGGSLLPRLIVSLALVSIGAHAEVTKKGALPSVLTAKPKGERAFLHAVLTADDVAALGEGDEKLIREMSAGQGDDGYLEAGFLTVALIEGRDLGARAVVVSKPLLRTQTLVDRQKRAYAMLTTLEVDFLARDPGGGLYPRLFFADESFPAQSTCPAGAVVVTSEDASKSARWPSRGELLRAMALKAGDDRTITELRFEPAQRGGRKLRGELRTLRPVGGACADPSFGAIKQVSLKRKDRHFYAPLTVNGVDVGAALIDTGATALTIPKRVAIAANLKTNGAVRVETANGVVEMTKATAELVTIGGLTVRAVDVTILPDDSGALIGMAVLEAFDVTVRGDTMTLAVP